MSTKFFTNKEQNTLENRLKDILKNYNIKNIEFLIGYFRMSGFKKIALLLKNVEKARILIGINTDKLTYEAEQRGKEINLYNQNKFIDEFKQNQQNILENEEYDVSVDESVRDFICMISQNKLELRISKEKNIHAKIYILRENKFTRHDGSIEYKGSVITGSSNLTQNGLTKNYEFNVELKDQADIEFALNEFESLWLKGVQITKDDVEDIQKNSYLNEVTPYELYIKFLLEHFEKRVDYDPSVADDLPKGYMKLAYQIDAVNEGLVKIHKHNGFFLSDVVGLGKTVTTAMIVKQLSLQIGGKILIVAPPSIKQEWLETFEQFQIFNQTFKSYGSLEKIKNTKNYSIVIIDESHKFKNFSTSRYKELERICKENTKYKKKIILISATPLNNAPSDIANQLYLFQDKRNSTIPSYPNLESFFAPIDKTYKEIIKLKEDGKSLSKDELKQLEDLAKKIRDNILREVMVRKTRTDIQENKIYREDLQRQNLNMPKIQPIQELTYTLDSELLKIFDTTIDILIKDLKYYRYRILEFLNSNGRKKYANMQENLFKMSSDNLAKIIKTSLIKTLESSFFAFKASIKKQKDSLEYIINMFENEEILIPTKKVNIYDLFDIDEDEYDDKIEYYIAQGNLKSFAKEDFDKEYLDFLKQDLKLLQDLTYMWESINYDPKLDKFKQILSHHKEKVVVFSESKKTVLYLKKELNKSNILTVHGENRNKLKDTIRENFDENYKNQKNDFNIIISTDTLSEGVNMHRSNIIYNYDIPWNSTRLMQRIGRINRIGTKHNEIFIYNFKPTAQSEEQIELSKKAFIKLQTFHSTVGEDTQIYTKDEKIGSVNLYQESDHEIDEELKFLEEIRAFKEAYPSTFNHILKLPNKIRVQRKSDFDTSYIFIKNKTSKYYYEVKQDVCKPINFIQMAKKLKTNKKEKGIMPYDPLHYLHVKEALNFYKSENLKIIKEKEKIEVKHKNDKTALSLLKSFRAKHFIDIDTYELFVAAITQGRFQNLSREIIKLKKSSEIVRDIAILQDKYSLLEQENNKNKMQIKANIILSETFLKDVK